MRGNLQAIQKNERFIDRDLNRAWTEQNLLEILENGKNTAEAKEVRELKSVLDLLIERANAPVLMMDFHTTSSYSSPFVILDDTLRNRKTAEKLPVTKVLGLLERLEGTILGYYGDKGPVTLVFEAGQHVEQVSVDRHVSAMWLSLIDFGIINEEDIDFSFHRDVLKRAAKEAPKLVETTLRYALNEGDSFTMQKGFSNFTAVKKGDLLASHNGHKVYAPRNAMVFMPLYQEKGTDGYFLVNGISTAWLWFSKVLRKNKWSRLITVLPGITQHQSKEDTYIVNTEIASFRALDFLHLLGFRQERRHKHLLYVSRLPYDLKGPWD